MAAIMTLPTDRPLEDAEAKWRRYQRTIFAVLVLFSVLAIGGLLFNPPTSSDWRDWIVLVGVILLPIITAIVLYRSMRNNWTAEQEEQTLKRTLGYVVLAPIALIVAVLAGVVLFSAFGWLASIPSWAAVIIVLLVLIYLKP